MEGRRLEETDPEALKSLRRGVGGEAFQQTMLRQAAEGRRITAGSSGGKTRGPKGKGLSPGNFSAWAGSRRIGRRGASAIRKTVSGSSIVWFDPLIGAKPPASLESNPGRSLGSGSTLCHRPRRCGWAGKKTSLG